MEANVDVIVTGIDAFLVDEKESHLVLRDPERHPNS